MGWTFDLLIIYKTGEEKIVGGVSSYDITDNGKCFVYVKNGRRGFVPVDSANFFGKEFDYKGNC